MSKVWFWIEVVAWAGILLISASQFIANGGFRENGGVFILPAMVAGFRFGRLREMGIPK